MIDGLRPYPTMKDSGVPELDEIPAHWEVNPIGRMGRLMKGRGGSKEDAASEGVPCVRYGDLYTKHQFFIEATESYITADRAEDYTPLQEGDVLFAGSGESMEEIGKSAVNLLDGVVCGGDVLLFRPSRAFVPRFLGYAADSPAMVAQKAAMGRGFTVVHVYGDELKRLQLPVPPLEEQEAIVRFLDHANHRIARYIRAKRKLIELLEEQKQAIIHRAVTRGLDPDVPLKRSVIPWLGDIPRHWQPTTLGRVVDRVVDGPHHSPDYLDEGVPFLSARNIRADGWRLDDAKYISESDYAEFSKRVVPEPGDVLYTKGGTTGVARLVDLDFRFQVWVHVAVLKVAKSRVLPEYLAIVLNSPRCYEQAQLATRGATNQDLGLNRMKSIAFPLPPLEEQETLVRHLEGATASLRRTMEVGRSEIELHREYRTRLIGDVVTGKLDVREVAAGLPDPAPESLSGADADASSDSLDGVLEGVEV